MRGERHDNVRGPLGSAPLGQLTRLVRPADIGGMLGVFGAAINYLLIRTRNAPAQHKTEEWWRLQHTISQLLDSYDGQN